MGEAYSDGFKGHRLGLLANQASLDRHLRSAKTVLSNLFPGQLKALFGPQHGYGGEDQDNMVETKNAADPALNIPVFSLYAESREPDASMLDRIDTLVIDLQDVGTRVYTFAATMLNCLKAASGTDKRMVILDRPNPLSGDTVEGNLLDPAYYSFVGPCRLPMRHGLTMGELAQLFIKEFGLDTHLEIIPMKGWRRGMLWSGTGLRWVMPSPNMPFPGTAMVYPGQVIWEGTNLSEGRGTCRPFEIFGAPYLNIQAIKSALEPQQLEGCVLQDYQFRPTFNKWAGELCHGFMLHILDPGYQPYWTSLTLLKAILDTHSSDFRWSGPPYEYEYQKKPIDMILGDPILRKNLEAGESLSGLRDRWLPELKDFLEWRKPYLIYRD
ncbi:MAG: DUF1343 domain-containing protein [Deltaproteobacteria bacterium]|nr:DUF1343 domain-containing protein [Deltaproteobacteria bacterium]